MSTKENKPMTGQEAIGMGREFGRVRKHPEFGYSILFTPKQLSTMIFEVRQQAMTPSENPTQND